MGKKVEMDTLLTARANIVVETQDLAEPLGLTNFRQRPSEGSVGHDDGMCKPCAWNWKPSGCSRESACTFCHMCPEDALKRKRQDKMQRRKQKTCEARQLATLPVRAIHSAL